MCLRELLTLDLLKKVFPWCFFLFYFHTFFEFRCLNLVHMYVVLYIYIYIYIYMLYYMYMLLYYIYIYICCIYNIKFLYFQISDSFETRTVNRYISCYRSVNTFSQMQLIWFFWFSNASKWRLLRFFLNIQSID